AWLDLEGHRGQSLRQGIVNLTRHPRSLVGARHLDRLLAESRALDGDADLIRDGRQKIELLPREPPPPTRGEVDHTKRTIAGVERNTGVIAQSAGEGRLSCLHGRREPRALDDVDVARG